MSAALADLPDGELAARALAGEDAAFAAIVARHKQPLHQLIARLIGDAGEAVDLVQEAFIAAHGALRRYDPERPMRAWLTRIAANKARDWHRRRIVRRMIAAVLPDDAATVPDDTPAVDRIVGDRAELRRVQVAIDKLPVRLREILVLRTIEELTQAEAADALGISQKAVETRLYRARQRLSALLGRTIEG